MMMVIMMMMLTWWPSCRSWPCPPRWSRTGWRTLRGWRGQVLCWEGCHNYVYKTLLKKLKPVNMCQKSWFENCQPGRVVLARVHRHLAGSQGDLNRECYCHCVTQLSSTIYRIYSVVCVCVLGIGDSRPNLHFFNTYRHKSPLLSQAQCTWSSFHNGLNHLY